MVQTVLTETDTTKKGSSNTQVRMNEREKRQDIAGILKQEEEVQSMVQSVLNETDTTKKGSSNTRVSMNESEKRQEKAGILKREEGDLKEFSDEVNLFVAKYINISLIDTDAVTRVFIWTNLSCMSMMSEFR